MKDFKPFPVLKWRWNSQIGMKWLKKLTNVSDISYVKEAVEGALSFRVKNDNLFRIAALLILMQK